MLGEVAVSPAASIESYYVTVRLPFVNQNASGRSMTSGILQQRVIIDTVRTVLDRRMEGRCSWLSR